MSRGSTNHEPVTPSDSAVAVPSPVRFCEEAAELTSSSSSVRIMADGGFHSSFTYGRYGASSSASSSARTECIETARRKTRQSAKLIAR